MDLELSLTPLDGIYIVLMCIIVGITILKNVPAILHTPLMSASNSISGIIILGGTIQILGPNFGLNISTLISALGILVGTINASGGFFVTHRMLKMFQTKK